MKKLNLLQITHDLRIGGLQEVVVNICRKIDKNKYDVKVLCLREKGDLSSRIEDLGIEVLALPKGKEKVDYFSFRKVARIIKENNIDIIHTHNTQPFFDGTLGAIFAGVKVVIHTDHARSFPDKKRYMFAEWLMSLYAYKVVGVSEHTCENLKNYEYISERKLEVIENGVDDSVYQISIDKSRKRKELGVPENAVIIGLGVRLVEQKGVSYLIKAMKEIVADYPEVILLIAGEGDKRSELEEEVHQLGLSANVKLLGPRLDMAELLKLFEIYVLPSFWEGLPMVLLEAMASGCPIVATDVGGVSAAVHHEVNGKLVRPRNVQELVVAITELLASPELRKQYADSGKKLFAEKYSATIMVKKYEKIYLSGYEKAYGKQAL